MNQIDKVELSIITPVFNEKKNIEEFLNRVEKVLHKINKTYEIILVDDFSADGTRELIENICDRNEKIKSIFLSKNFGHQAALFAGLKNSNGNYSITLDCDLQDPPELIEDLYNEIKKNYDVINTKRISRKGENNLKLSLIYLFYLINKIFFKNIEYNIGDFRIINNKIRKIVTIDRKVFFYRALIQTLGFKQKTIKYNREKRFDGKSKANLKYLFTFAFYGIFNASTIPLNFIFYLLILLSFPTIGLITLFYLNILNLNLSHIFFILSIIGISILFSLAIIGQYIKYIYEITIDKPLFIVDRYINFN